MPIRSSSSRCSANIFRTPQTFTSFLALPKSSSILVTEIQCDSFPGASSTGGRRAGGSGERILKLERADATKVVEMLKEVFEKGTQPAIPGVAGAPVIPGVKGVRPVAPVTAQQKEEIISELSGFTALSEDSIVVGKIKIAADVRTNRIHVITRPINMPFVRKLIAEFDANVAFGKPVARALRYISAAEILPVLVQALTEPGSSGQTGAEGAGAAPQPVTRNTSTSNTRGLDSGFGNSSGGQNFSEELSTQAVDTTPKAVTIGNAENIADQRANTIIILGNREVVVKVTKILDEMDIKAHRLF